MAQEVLAQTQAGNIVTVPDMKRRQRAIYWRPNYGDDGEIVGWRPTMLLPSDPLSQIQYLAKGFRLTPPGDDEVPASFEEQENLTTENTTLREQNSEQAVALAKMRAELNEFKRTQQEAAGLGEGQFQHGKTESKLRKGGSP